MRRSKVISLVHTIFGIRRKIEQQYFFTISCFADVDSADSGNPVLLLDSANSGNLVFCWIAQIVPIKSVAV